MTITDPFPPMRPPFNEGDAVQVRYNHERYFGTVTGVFNAAANQWRVTPDGDTKAEVIHGSFMRRVAKVERRAA